MEPHRYLQAMLNAITGLRRSSIDAEALSGNMYLHKLLSTFLEHFNKDFLQNLNLQLNLKKYDYVSDKVEQLKSSIESMSDELKLDV